MRATDASKKALYLAPRRPINPLISPKKCALPATPHARVAGLRPIEAAARQIAWPFPGPWPQGSPLSGPRLHARVLPETSSFGDRSPYAQGIQIDGGGRPA